MPKFPQFSNRVTKITGSVFEKYRDKMIAQGENLVKLHIGDTYLHPPYELPVHESFCNANKIFNQYCDTFGIAPLRAALAEKLQTDNQVPAAKANILVTSGATNALSVSVMTLIEPGEEVLILTPAWPFFFGMVKMAGGQIIEAPFYTKLFDHLELDIGDYLQSFVSSKTAAIYLNTPNNPSSKVLNYEQVRQVAEFAQKHDLWVISDEAYDGLTFDGLPHHSIASLPNMFERTLSIFTFSKTFMFAGLRLGFLAASASAITNLNKSLVHQIYSPSTVAQQMMVEPVKNLKQWLPRVQERFQALRDVVMDNLAVDFPKPEGTYFVFFPATKYLRGRDYWQLIEACLNAGVSVAPGDSFGRDFSEYIRLCFTGEPPERLEMGLERLNQILLFK
ncbi:MAG: pyridoxal phosphate-dependent aminotransferase [bacterium]